MTTLREFIPFRFARFSIAICVRAAAVVLLLLSSAAPTVAGTVTGVVRNGTNDAVAGGVDVVLIRLAGSMETVADTKTDAQGKYRLDHPEIGQQPMLIRAVYGGVMFHKALPPGESTADVTIYEPSSDPKLLKVGTRVIVFQPSNGMLLVGEEYGLQNSSQPPRAYFNQNGDFDFELPEGAQLSQVSSWGPAGMPVVQGTINRGERRYAIAYAFQPGENGVRLSYQMPYESNSAKVRFNSLYALDRVLLVAPPSVKIESAGFVPAGTEQGFSLYGRDNIPAGGSFEVSVSGTAPAPTSTGAPGQGQDTVNGRDAGAPIQTLPNRLDSLKWILIGGFATLFALGATLIWRRPVAVGPGEWSSSPAPKATPGRKKPLPVQPPEKAMANNHTLPSAAGVEAEVDRSLDALKDRLFRLELRHQAGTISDEDYATERSRTEQILRELVRG
jgi:hypothetical protein